MKRIGKYLKKKPVEGKNNLAWINQGFESVLVSVFSKDKKSFLEAWLIHKLLLHTFVLCFILLIYKQPKIMLQHVIIN